MGSLGELTVVSDGLVPFIGQVPLDDGWNNIFRYRSDAGDSYTLASLGVDLMANTPWESGNHELLHRRHRDS